MNFDLVLLSFISFDFFIGTVDTTTHSSAIQKVYTDNRENSYQILYFMEGKGINPMLLKLFVSNYIRSQIVIKTSRCLCKGYLQGLFLLMLRFSCHMEVMQKEGLNFCQLLDSLLINYIFKKSIMSQQTSREKQRLIQQIKRIWTPSKRKIIQRQGRKAIFVADKDLQQAQKCHVMGIAVTKAIFKWAVWQFPEWELDKNLINQINWTLRMTPNFVINSADRNKNIYGRGQKVICKHLMGTKLHDISAEELELGSFVLKTIVKRFLWLLIKRLQNINIQDEVTQKINLMVRSKIGEFNQEIRTRRGEPVDVEIDKEVSGSEGQSYEEDEEIWNNQYQAMEEQEIVSFQQGQEVVEEQQSIFIDEDEEVSGSEGYSYEEDEEIWNNSYQVMEEQEIVNSQLRQQVVEEEQSIYIDDYLIKSKQQSKEEVMFKKKGKKDEQEKNVEEKRFDLIEVLFKRSERLQEELQALKEELALLKSQMIMKSSPVKKKRPKLTIDDDFDDFNQETLKRFSRKDDTL